jgi:hypothetical protein
VSATPRPRHWIQAQGHRNGVRRPHFGHRVRPSPGCRLPAAAHVASPARLEHRAGIAHFTGRADALRTLTGLVGEADATRGAVVISAIDGTAGIGKTALAVHWAQQAAGSFPDGQLYVNLRGFDPAGAPVEAAEAIRGFLDALGVPSARIPADPGAQAGLYRSLLAGKRMLIVLDNARDPHQVRPLLPGSAGCLVLVTSRSQLSGLIAVDGARPLTVDLLGRTVRTNAGSPKGRESYGDGGLVVVAGVTTRQG